MSFKYRLATAMMINGLQGIVDLNEGFIGGRILGAFISEDYMTKEDVEDWVDKQDHDLFYFLGYLEGLKFRVPWLYNCFYHYGKTQAMMTCVYKRYWKVKTYIHADKTGKTKEHAAICDCQKFERPDCLDRDKCTTMTE